MSTVRVLAHEDVGAPPCYGYSRTAIYAWLDILFTQGYNVKFINNFVRSGRYVTLNYAEPHGYKKARLLLLEGSSFTGFNDKLYRVLEVPSPTSLKIYIKDAAWETYPETLTEVSFKSKIAPLNWEKVYSSSSQISFRSKRTDSSKVVVTIKAPTYPYHATALKTTAAVCYEMDFSKDVDITTGSPIDSCLINDKATYGHSCQYWVMTSNQDNLQESPNWNSETLRVPWTIFGDDKFVYIIMSPYNDGLNENSSYRTISPMTSGAYPNFKTLSFGDYEAIDSNEYLIGSSFFFNARYYANNSSREDNIVAGNPYDYTPFLMIQGTYARYTYYYSAYDPLGTRSGARIVCGGSTPYSSYNGSGNSFIWNSYPERITGGITYYPYYAYENSAGVTTNSVQSFLKGTFPIVRCCATSLRNLGNNRDQHLFVFNTDQPTKMLISHQATGQSYYWTHSDSYCNYLFELD